MASTGAAKLQSFTTQLCDAKERHIPDNIRGQARQEEDVLNQQF
jgi:hypothetical protein